MKKIRKNVQLQKPIADYYEKWSSITGLSQSYLMEFVLKNYMLTQLTPLEKDKMIINLRHN